MMEEPPACDGCERPLKLIRVIDSKTVWEWVEGGYGPLDQGGGVKLVCAFCGREVDDEAFDFLADHSPWEMEDLLPA